MNSRKGLRAFVFGGSMLGEIQQKSLQPILTSAGALPMRRKREPASVAGLDESIE